MQTFTAASIKAPDSSKHVNYTQGMVLGADDFTQEFAFHNGRNEWLLRDVAGYGTVSGLRVSVDSTGGKRRVRVTAGTAVSPRGEMIRVCCDQCADLDQWLQTNQDQVAARLAPLGSPPSSLLSLYVTLGYRECPADQVPIPGEPCRSEDDAMAPSRLKDDFTIELRFEPPRQAEEDVLRRMFDWLRQIPVSDGGLISPPVNTLEDVLDTVRQAARDAFASPPESPPSSPPDIFVGSPPGTLVIPGELAPSIWRAVFLLWVTELRPAWQTRFISGNSCCSNQESKSSATDEGCLLLAEINVPLGLGSSSQWQLAGPFTVSEDRRPYLLHLRALQEWLTGASARSGLGKSDAVTHPPSTGTYSIVAAGRVRGSLATPTVAGLGAFLPYNGLRILNDSGTSAGVLMVTFDSYNSPLPGQNQYLVKVLPGRPAPGVGPGPGAKAVAVMFDQFLPGFFQLHVASETGDDIAQADLANMEFMIEVSECSA